VEFLIRKREINARIYQVKKVSTRRVRSFLPAVFAGNVAFQQRLKTSTQKHANNRYKWFLTEPGMYMFVATCKSAIAKNFLKWVFTEVVPQIRKTGSYSLSPEAKAQLEEINDGLRKNLETQDAEMKQLRADLDKKQEENTNINHRLMSVQQHLSNQKDEIDHLFEEKTFLTSKLDHLNSIIEHRLAENQELKMQVADLEAPASLIRADSDHPTNVMESNRPLVTAESTRLDFPALRCLTHTLFNHISYRLVTIFHEMDGTGGYMTEDQIMDAIVSIMEVNHWEVRVTSRHCKNPIALFTKLSGLARQRLEQNDYANHKYSTMMPIMHAYCYAKNFNAWNELNLGQPPLHEQLDIEKVFGDQVSQFYLD